MPHYRTWDQPENEGEPRYSGTVKSVRTPKLTESTPPEPRLREVTITVPVDLNVRSGDTVSIRRLLTDEQIAKRVRDAVSGIDYSSAKGLSEAVENEGWPDLAELLIELWVG